MNYQVKNGYILIEELDVDVYNLAPNWDCGRIIGGPDQDLGTIVFFEEGKAYLFDQTRTLLSIDDVRFFILPERTKELQDIKGDAPIA